jgi:hypothetical protein
MPARDKVAPTLAEAKAAGLLPDRNPNTATLQHSQYIDVQARTLIACMHAMVTGLPAAMPG